MKETAKQGYTSTGKHVLENEIAFGSERATSGCWPQVSCGSWLHAWNTAT